MLFALVVSPKAPKAGSKSNGHGRGRFDLADPFESDDVALGVTGFACCVREGPELADVGDACNLVPPRADNREPRACLGFLLCVSRLSRSLFDDSLERWIARESAMAVVVEAGTGSTGRRLRVLNGLEKTTDQEAG